MNKCHSFLIKSCQFVLVGLFFLITFLFINPAHAFAFTCTSSAGGNWGTAGTWANCNSTTPQSTDTAVICNSATVTMNTTATVTTLTLGNASVTGCSGGSKGSGTIAFNAGSQLTATTVNVGSGAGASAENGTITMTSGGTLVVGSGGIVVTNTPTFTAGTGTVQLSAAQTLPSNIAFNIYNNLTVAAGGNNIVNLGENTVVNGTLTLSSGELDVSVSLDSLTVNGDWINNSSATTPFNQRATTVSFLSSGPQSIGGSVVTSFGSLNASGNGTVTANTNYNISGTLTIGASQTWTSAASVQANPGGSAGALNVGGTLQVTRTAADLKSQYQFTTYTIGSGSVVDYNGTGETINAFTYNKLKISGSITGAETGTATVNNTMTITGTFTPGAQAVSMGSATSSINNSGTCTFNNLTIAATPNAQTQYNTSFSVAGALTVSSGITFAPSGGTITMNSASSLVNSSGTLIFNNLTLASSAGTITSSGSFAVVGTFTVNSGAVFTPAATDVISGTGGTLTGSGTVQVTRTAATADFLDQYTMTTITLTNLEVDYVGSTAQTVNDTSLISNLAYSTLKVMPAASSLTFTFAPGTTSVSGDVTFGDGSHTSDIVTAATNSTTLTVTGTLTIASGTTFIANGSNATSVGGNWTNGGAFTHSSGNVVFTGSGIHTLTGATTFYDFTDTTAGATLKFHAGTIFTFAHNFTVTGTSSNIAIRSDTPSSQWKAHFTLAQPSSVTFATITDSGCDTGAQTATVTSANNDTNGGGNDTSCWDFTGPLPTDTPTPTPTLTPTPLPQTKSELNGHVDIRGGTTL